MGQHSINVGAAIYERLQAQAETAGKSLEQITEEALTK